MKKIYKNLSEDKYIYATKYSILKRYASAIGSIMMLFALGATLSMYFLKYKSSITDYYIYNELRELKERNEILAEKLKNEIAENDKLKKNITENNKLIIGSSKNNKDIGVNQQINKIEKKLNEIDDRTIALKQAINPYRPEEVLTVVRVKDEVNILKNRIEQIYDMLKREQDNFKNAVAREIDATGKSVYLILIVLIPLVFNFLYTTVWKDFREQKKEKAIREKANEENSP